MLTRNIFLVLAASFVLYACTGGSAMDEGQLQAAEAAVVSGGFDPLPADLRVLVNAPVTLPPRAGLESADLSPLPGHWATGCVLELRL